MCTLILACQVSTVCAIPIFRFIYGAILAQRLTNKAKSVVENNHCTNHCQPLIPNHKRSNNDCTIIAHSGVTTWQGERVAFIASPSFHNNIKIVRTTFVLPTRGKCNATVFYTRNNTPRHTWKHNTLHLQCNRLGPYLKTTTMTTPHADNTAANAA